MNQTQAILWNFFCFQLPRPDYYLTNQKKKKEKKRKRKEKKTPPYIGNYN
jgi:hypothetical protein